MRGERPADVRKIAVLRANAVGDFVFALPALAALKAAYPQAELVLLAREWHAAFLAGRPSPIDRTIVLPPIDGISRPAGSGDPFPLHFVDALRAERFDVAIQLHGGGAASNPFLAQIGARLTVGMRAPGAAPLDRWVRYIYFHNEILRYLEVVALIGVAPDGIDPEIAVTDADLRESETVVPAGVPFAVIHPGATDERRRWPAERFAAVADRLAEDGLVAVVTGDGSESALVRRCAAAMRRPAIDAAGRLSLGGLAGLLARAQVAIGNDTGPLHLARAVGAPSVTIYWIGNLINGAPVTRHLHRAIGSWQLDCPVCGIVNVDVRCRHQVSFLERVAVEDVVEQARDVLALARDGLGEQDVPIVQKAR